jgi:hypothetical protein
MTPSLLGVLRVDDWLQGRTVTDTDLKTLSVTGFLIYTLRIAQAFVLVGVPMLLGDVVSLDRKLRTREMLATFPLPIWVYLAGKMLNLWFNAVRLSLGVLVLIAVAGLLIFGGFDLRLVVFDWLLVELPLLLFVAALAALVPSFAYTRRAALFTGILLVPFCLIAFSAVILHLFDTAGLIDPLYRFANLMTSPYLSPEQIIRNSLTLYAQGTAILGAVYAVAWGMQRLQQR